LGTRRRPSSTRQEQIVQPCIRCRRQHTDAEQLGWAKTLPPTQQHSRARLAAFRGSAESRVAYIICTEQRRTTVDCQRHLMLHAALCLCSVVRRALAACGGTGGAVGSSLGRASIALGGALVSGELFGWASFTLGTHATSRELTSSAGCITHNARHNCWYLLIW
jgi:hypothetical protein